MLLCAVVRQSIGNVNDVQVIVSSHRPVPPPAWVHVRVHTRRTQRVVRCSPGHAPVVRAARGGHVHAVGSLRG